MHLSFPHKLLHAPPISSFLVWSTECLARSTRHEAPHYSVFSIPLLPHPPLGLTIVLSTLFTNTSLSVRDQVSHPYYKNFRLEVVSVHMFMVTLIKVQSLTDTRIPSSPSLYSHGQLNQNGQSRFNTKQRHQNFFTTSQPAV
jgi:hypothetical protein